MHLQGQPDDGGDAIQPGRFGDGCEGGASLAQQRGLVEEIGARVTGDAQFGEERQAAALCCRLCHRRDDLGRVERDIGHTQLGGDDADAHETKRRTRKYTGVVCHERITSTALQSDRPDPFYPSHAIGDNMGRGTRSQV